MTETLQQGPIYFFDQPKMKRKCMKKMEPETFGNFISDSTEHGTGSFHRKSGCTEEHMEGNGALMKNSSVKQVLVPPQACGGPFIVQPTFENVHTQYSQIASHVPTKVLQPMSLDQYKSTAATILQELEDMLNHVSNQKIIVPLGILNILNYSWKDLTEGAWYNKKYCQELVYNNVNSSRREAPEMSNRLLSTSELTDCEMAECITRKSKKPVGFPDGTAKESENPGALLNKTSQECTNDSISAISFSLSSTLCKEKSMAFPCSVQSGWISQHTDHVLKDLEWKVPYVLAVERLQKAKFQMY